MKFSKEERLQIGREIYTDQLKISEAVRKYDINRYTARDYMREYRDENNLPPKSDGKEEFKILSENKRKRYEDLKDLSREELIDEVIKARVEAERAKKGYSVKGGGQEKEYIILSKESMK